MFERIMSVCAVVMLLGCPIVAGCEGGSREPQAHTSRAPAPIPQASAAPVETKAEPSKETQPMAKAAKIVKSDAEWRKSLTPQQYEVLREKGTERPFTGKYWDTKTPGVYKCAACGTVLFSSDNKFDAHCGWPSFDRMIEAGTVEEHTDTTFGMTRTEVVCAKCGGHLGHVFNDGPTDTGMRYCINSASIELDEKKPEPKP